MIAYYDTSTVSTVSDFATFRLFSCFSNIHCYSTSLGFGIQIAWSRTRVNVAKSHHVKVATNYVESQQNRR